MVEKVVRDEERERETGTQEPTVSGPRVREAHVRDGRNAKETRDVSAWLKARCLVGVDERETRWPNAT